MAILSKDKERGDKMADGMKSLYVKTAFRIASIEFERWMRNSRLIILGVMLVFIHMQVISTLQNCTSMMGEPVAILEAFVALGNSGVIVLVVPLLFVVLIADFPQSGSTDFFYQIRCSKKIWVLGQILFAIEAAGFAVIFLVVSSSIMMAGTGEWKMEFSHAVTHYASAFPERSGDYILQLLPENLYQQMDLATAFIHTVFLMFLYFLLMAMILLLFSLCNRKYAGILADVILILLGALTCAANSDFMWIFPMAHSITWLHYEKYLREAVFPIAGSYLYFLFLSIICIMVCFIVSRKYQAGKG